jgi:hypothetical protein
MSELFVRTALPYLNKAQRVQNRDNFSRLQNPDAPHSVNDNGLRADELRFECRLAIIEQHCNYFSKVGVQLIERGTLAMRSRKAGNLTDEKVCVGAAFNYGGIGAHGAVFKRNVSHFTSRGLLCGGESPAQQQLS